MCEVVQTSYMNLRMHRAALLLTFDKRVTRAALGVVGPFLGAFVIDGDCTLSQNNCEA